MQRTFASMLFLIGFERGGDPLMNYFVRHCDLRKSEHYDRSVIISRGFMETVKLLISYRDTERNRVILYDDISCSSQFDLLFQRLVLQKAVDDN